MEKSMHLFTDASSIPDQTTATEEQERLKKELMEAAKRFNEAGKCPVFLVAGIPERNGDDIGIQGAACIMGNGKVLVQMLAGVFNGDTDILRLILATLEEAQTSRMMELLNEIQGGGKE